MKYGQEVITVAEYRRFISYMYLYEDGRKTENSGYVRVESRDGECRIHIHMTHIEDIQNEAYIVYLLLRESGGYIGVRIGQLEPNISPNEWEFTTDSEHLMGTEYRLDMMSAMVICGRGTGLYGTRWDDEPLDTRCFEMEDSISENIVCFGSGAAEKEVDSSEPISEEAELDDESMLVEPETDSAIVVTAVDGCEEQKLDLYAQIMQRFPRMYPFDDDGVEDCVKLELPDISHLPMRYWFYGSNSFLLHGYYCYGHLILARMTDGLYILGVPGIWQYRERYLAAMFGFPYFKPVSQAKQSEGSFGYWYIRCDMDPVSVEQQKQPEITDESDS